jgi:hypothetical protein
MIRVTVWLVKGVLLLVAVAALVAWPWIYRHPGRIRLKQFRARPDGVEHQAYFAGVGRGVVGVADYHGVYAGAELAEGRREAAAHGPGWKLHAFPVMPDWVTVRSDADSGPFRRLSFDYKNVDSWVAGYGVGIPCWAVALLAGAWPLTSVALLVRRRLRCCRQCGYDLRATPERCPECGATASSAR